MRICLVCFCLSHDYRLVERRTAAILRGAESVESLDALLAMANAVADFDLIRPRVTEQNVLHIEDGRHLLQERTVEGQFVPNGAEFGLNKGRIHIITGPNGSGKSVYLKQSCWIYTSNINIESIF
jgi:DNA mismatch repair protein MSH5